MSYLPQTNTTIQVGEQPTLFSRLRDFGSQFISSSAKNPLPLAQKYYGAGTRPRDTAGGRAIAGAGLFTASILKGITSIPFSLAKAPHMLTGNKQLEKQVNKLEETFQKPLTGLQNLYRNELKTKEQIAKTDSLIENIFSDEGDIKANRLKELAKDVDFYNMVIPEHVGSFVGSGLLVKGAQTLFQKGGSRILNRTVKNAELRKKLNKLNTAISWLGGATVINLGEASGTGEEVQSNLRDYNYSYDEFIKQAKKSGDYNAEQIKLLENARLDEEGVRERTVNAMAESMSKISTTAVEWALIFGSAKFIPKNVSQSLTKKIMDIAKETGKKGAAVGIEVLEETFERDIGIRGSDPNQPQLGAENIAPFSYPRIAKDITEKQGALATAGITGIATLPLLFIGRRGSGSNVFSSPVTAAGEQPVFLSEASTAKVNLKEVRGALGEASLTSEDGEQLTDRQFNEVYTLALVEELMDKNAHFGTLGFRETENFISRHGIEEITQYILDGKPGFDKDPYWEVSLPNKGHINLRIDRILKDTDDELFSDQHITEALDTSLDQEAFLEKDEQKGKYVRFRKATDKDRQEATGKMFSAVSTKGRRIKRLPSATVQGLAATFKKGYEAVYDEKKGELILPANTYRRTQEANSVFIANKELLNSPVMQVLRKMDRIQLITGEDRNIRGKTNIHTFYTTLYRHLANTTVPHELTHTMMRLGYETGYITGQDIRNLYMEVKRDFPDLTYKRVAVKDMQLPPIDDPFMENTQGDYNGERDAQYLEEVAAQKIAEQEWKSRGAKALRDYFKTIREGKNSIINDLAITLRSQELAQRVRKNGHKGVENMMTALSQHPESYTLLKPSDIPTDTKLTVRQIEQVLDKNSDYTVQSMLAQEALTSARQRMYGADIIKDRAEEVRLFNEIPYEDKGTHGSVTFSEWQREYVMLLPIMRSERVDDFYLMTVPHHLRKEQTPDTENYLGHIRKDPNKNGKWYDEITWDPQKDAIKNLKLKTPEIFYNRNGIEYMLRQLILQHRTGEKIRIHKYITRRPTLEKIVSRDAITEETDLQGNEWFAITIPNKSYLKRTMQSLMAGGDIVPDDLDEKVRAFGSVRNALSETLPTPKGDTPEHVKLRTALANLQTELEKKDVPISRLPKKMVIDFLAGKSAHLRYQFKGEDGTMKKVSVAAPSLKKITGELVETELQGNYEQIMDFDIKIPETYSTREPEHEYADYEKMIGKVLDNYTDATYAPVFLDDRFTSLKETRDTTRFAEAAGKHWRRDREYNNDYLDDITVEEFIDGDSFAEEIHSYLNEHGVGKMTTAWDLIHEAENYKWDEDIEKEKGNEELAADLKQYKDYSWYDMREEFSTFGYNKWVYEQENVDLDGADDYFGHYRYAKTDNGDIVIIELQSDWRKEMIPIYKDKFTRTRNMTEYERYLFENAYDILINQIQKDFPDRVIYLPTAQSVARVEGFIGQIRVEDYANVYNHLQKGLKQRMDMVQDVIKEIEGTGEMTKTAEYIQDRVIIEGMSLKEDEFSRLLPLLGEDDEVFVNITLEKSAPFSTELLKTVKEKFGFEDETLIRNNPAMKEGKDEEEKKINERKPLKERSIGNLMKNMKFYPSFYQEFLNRQQEAMDFFMQEDNDAGVETIGYSGARKTFKMFDRGYQNAIIDRIHENYLNAENEKDRLLWLNRYNFFTKYQIPPLRRGEEGHKIEFIDTRTEVPGLGQSHAVGLTKDGDIIWTRLEVGDQFENPVQQIDGKIYLTRTPDYYEGREINDVTDEEIEGLTEWERGVVLSYGNFLRKAGEKGEKMTRQDGEVLQAINKAFPGKQMVKIRNQFGEDTSFWEVRTKPTKESSNLLFDQDAPADPYYDRVQEALAKAPPEEKAILKKIRKEKRSVPSRMYRYTIMRNLDVIADTSPEIAELLSKSEYYEMIRNFKAMEMANALNRALNRLERKNKIDFGTYQLALSEEDFGRAKEIAEKHGFMPELLAMFDYLDGTGVRLVNLGFNITNIENYFPRSVKDPRGLLTMIDSKRNFPIRGALEAKIKSYEKRWQRSPSEELKIGWINQMIQKGNEPKVSLKSSHLKKRKIQRIDSSLIQFYAKPQEALVNYIFRIERLISVAELLGRDNLKKQEEKAKINELEPNLGTIDLFYDMEASIGSFLVGKNINPTQEQEILRALRASLSSLPTPREISFVRNITYPTLLGGPTSAIVQFLDLSLQSVKWGPAPVLGGAIRVIGGKPATQDQLEAKWNNFVSRETTFLENIAAEAVEGELSNRITNYSLFMMINVDAFGKAVIQTTAFNRMVKFARKNQPERIPHFNTAFVREEERQKVLDDLKNKRLTMDVKFLIVANLNDTQPIFRSSAPMAYLENPNLRWAYLLQRFNISWLGFSRNELFGRPWYLQDDKQFARRTRNIITYIAILLAIGIPEETLRRFITNKDAGTLGEIATDTIFRGLPISRYDVQSVQRQGIVDAAVDIVAPPFRIIEDTQRTITSFWDNEEGIDGRIIRNLPWVGQALYDHVLKEVPKKKITQRQFQQLGESFNFDSQDVRFDSFEVMGEKINFQPFDLDVPKFPNLK